MNFALRNLGSIKELLANANLTRISSKMDIDYLIKLYEDIIIQWLPLNT